MRKANIPSSWAAPLTELFARESGLNWKAKNPNSSASGYAQFINSTRSDYERRYGVKYDSPINQLYLGIQYVKDRYGSPVKALQHWDQKKWY
jgi:SLT domain-containing protein